MHTKLSSLFAIVLSFAAITPASASFTGAYDVLNWTTSGAFGGTVDISHAPNSITLTSGDDGSGNLSNVDFTIAATAAGNVSFHWLYQTLDADSSTYDPFGYLLNNAFFQLSPDALLQNGIASGDVSFAVIAGDTFGFSAISYDSLLGPSVTIVSNFNGPVPTAPTVPEPATLALVGLGLVCIGFRRRQAA